MSIEPPHYRISRIANEMERSGREILHLEIGDPEVETDKRIIEAMYRAALEGATHYGPTNGIPELREKISDYMKDLANVDVDPSMISTSPGSKVAIYTALKLLNPGRIHVVEPMWGLYHSFAEEIGVEVRRILTRYEDNWELKRDIEDVREGEVIAVVNPNNPTGTVLSRDSIERIVDAASSTGAYIVADEVYFDLVYRGGFTSFLEYDYEKILTIYSFSKNYAMAGFRIGWVIANSRDLINSFIKRLRLIVGGPAPFTQYAALEALSNRDILERNKSFYIEGLEYVSKRLKSLGFDFVEPSAGMYIFAKPPLNMDGGEFSIKLLKEKGVAVSPGTAFGDYPEFIRIVTGLKRERLARALGLIEEFIYEARQT